MLRMTEPTAVVTYQATNISVNGVTARLSAPTLQAALASVGLCAETGHIAIAVNDSVIPRAQWGILTLRTGDTVEIITAVAGG